MMTIKISRVNPGGEGVTGPLPPLPVFTLAHKGRAMVEIPETMAHARRWFLYRVTWVEDPERPGNLKLKKFPICIDGSDWDEPDHWVSFGEMCEKIHGHNEDQDYWIGKGRQERYRYWPGFPITKEFKAIFIDLDKCFLPDGSLSQTAWKFLNALHGARKDAVYVEISISGKGLHLFCWYTGKRKFSTTPEDGVEIYLDKRGALITGDAFHG